MYSLNIVVTLPLMLRTEMPMTSLELSHTTAII